MPTLIIRTNVETPIDDRRRILAEASALAANFLGKPEGYSLGHPLRTTRICCLPGIPHPWPYLELKSLGLPEERTPELSAALCGFMETRFGVSPARVYIEFASPPQHLFGYNDGTF